MHIDPNESLVAIESQLNTVNRKLGEGEDKSTLTSIFRDAVVDLDHLVEETKLSEEQWKRVIVARGKVDSLIEKFGDEVPIDLSNTRDHLVKTLAEQSLGILNTLPLELQHMVTEFLEAKDVAALRGVSQSTKEVMDDPTIQTPQKQKFYKEKLEEAIGGTEMYRELLEDDSTDWELAFRTYSPLKGTCFPIFEEIMKVHCELQNVLDPKSSDDIHQMLLFLSDEDNTLSLDEEEKEKLKAKFEEQQDLADTLNVEDFSSCAPQIFFKPGQYLKAIANGLKFKNLRTASAGKAILKKLSEDNPLIYCTDESSRVNVFFRVKNTEGQEIVLVFNQNKEGGNWNLSRLPVKGTTFMKRHSDFSKTLYTFDDWKVPITILYRILHGSKAFIAEVDLEGEGSLDPNIQFWAVGFNP